MIYIDLIENTQRVEGAARMLQTEELGIERGYMRLRCNADGIVFVLSEKIDTQTIQNEYQVDAFNAIKEGLNASFAIEKRFNNENIQRNTA